MTIDRITYFLDLVKTLNYTETAEHFFTTQSNISKQIIALEKELGVTLFIREHRKIVLSPAGMVFLSYADKFFTLQHEMDTALSSFRTINQTLHICSIPVMSLYNVTGLLSKFYKLHENILLDIQEMESIQLLPALDDGTSDIAFIRLFNEPDNKYERITFEHDELAVILPKNHSLAHHTRLSLLDLRDENFLQLNANTKQFNLVRNACQSAGFEPKIGYTGTRMNNILSFVSSGMGISLLMRHSVESSHNADIVIIPLSQKISSELAFLRLRKEKHTKACDLFWKFLQEISIRQKDTNS